MPALDQYSWSSGLFNLVIQSSSARFAYHHWGRLHIHRIVSAPKSVVLRPITQLGAQELLKKSRKMLPPYIRVGSWYKSTPYRSISPKPVDKWRKTVDKPTWLGKTRKFVRISHFWAYPYMGGVVIQLPDIFPPCGIRSGKQSRTFSSHLLPLCPVEKKPADCPRICAWR
jgi:hypothetical protein